MDGPIQKTVSFTKSTSPSYNNSVLGNVNPSQEVSLPSSSRQVYWNLVERIKKNRTAESKYDDLFSTHDLRWNFSINYCIELYYLYKQ